MPNIYIEVTYPKTQRGIEVLKTLLALKKKVRQLGVEEHHCQIETPKDLNKRYCTAALSFMLDDDEEYSHIPYKLSNSKGIAELPRILAEDLSEELGLGQEFFRS